MVLQQMQPEIQITIQVACPAATALDSSSVCISPVRTNERRHEMYDSKCTSLCLTFLLFISFSV